MSESIGSESAMCVIWEFVKGKRENQIEIEHTKDKNNAEEKEKKA